MLKKSSISIEKAFEKACKENDIIFHEVNKNSEANEITLVDSKGRNFKLDKNLKVVDISDWSNVSLQSLQAEEAKAAGNASESSDLYRNEPLYLKTADGVDLALVALGPQVNKTVQRVYDNEGTAFNIPYLTIDGEQVRSQSISCDFVNMNEAVNYHKAGSAANNKVRKHKAVKGNISGRRIQNKNKES